MDEIEVKIFQSEPLETLIAGFERCLVSVIAVPKFCCYEYILSSDPTLADGSADV